VKKSPAIADMNTEVYGKCIDMGSGVVIDGGVPVADRHLAVEMIRVTGDDSEAYRVFDIVFFIFNLPARHRNVGKYRQYNRRKFRIWLFS